MGWFDTPEQKRQKLWDKAMSQGPAVMIACMEKWKYYNSVLKFKEDVPLEDIIYGFISPISEFARQEFPDVIRASPALLVTFVFAGIEASGTHSKEVVGTARAAFADKYDAPFLIQP